MNETIKKFEWDSEKWVVIFAGSCITDEDDVNQANETLNFILNTKLKEERIKTLEEVLEKYQVHPYPVLLDWLKWEINNLKN